MSDTVQKEGLDAETIRKYEAEYVLTPWTAQKGLNPFVAAKAKGCWVYNKEGRKYLDLTSQFVFTNLGHCDDRVNAAIAKQAALLPSVNSQWATEPKARLGKLLAEVTPGDLKKSFFSTGGTEANEGAIKIARWATGKQKVLSRWRSYHGSTMGAMAVSADYRNWCAEPAVPGALHILPPYCYRCHFGATYPSCDIQCAKHVEDVIRLEGGARRVAAVIGEPIFGAGGIIVPPDEYWPMVRAICDKYEVGADCRRNHDRLRPDRKVVRYGQLGGGAGHHDPGQGHQLGRGAVGRNRRAAVARGEVRDPAVPARAHLFGSCPIHGGSGGDN